MCEYAKIPSKALRQRKEKGCLIAEWIEIDNFVTNKRKEL